jgi:hypothetical protein
MSGSPSRRRIARSHGAGSEIQRRLRSNPRSRKDLAELVKQTNQTAGAFFRRRRRVVRLVPHAERYKKGGNGDL